MSVGFWLDDFCDGWRELLGNVKRECRPLHWNHFLGEIKCFVKELKLSPFLGYTESFFSFLSFDIHTLFIVINNTCIVCYDTFYLFLKVKVTTVHRENWGTRVNKSYHYWFFRCTKPTNILLLLRFQESL